MARTNKPMSELATGISQQLGVSTFWARQVCTGEKVPSVAFLHGLVGFFGKSQYGEAFFTAPAADALDRALQPVLATLEPAAANQTRAGEAAATAGTEHDDVRGIALRQARNLPPERWKVLNATLTALLLLDDGEEDL
ncbi:hypothetical protein ACIQAC_33000 [Streptomyces sp. NPDC088387]|uniref:hypothetical protein n=1 Tax=Streptomyces sp. NPDC088387 TaxID=3365859 RepID=UPI00381F4339